jgi:hypothetical protein
MRDELEKIRQEAVVSSFNVGCKPQSVLAKIRRGYVANTSQTCYNSISVSGDRYMVRILNYTSSLGEN